MLWRAIVGVNDVTGGATAAAIVAGFVVCAGQRKQWIEQARFLQAEKNGIGAEQSAEAAFAELVVGAAGFFFAIGIADFAFFLAAAFEYAQDVAGLRNFPTLQRRQFRHDAFRACFFGSGRWHGEKCLGLAVGGIAFAEARIFQREGSVVI